MSEDFDIKKLITSPFTGLFWVKVIMFGLGLACLGFVGYGVFKAYFKLPPPTTEQKAEIIINPTYAPRSTFGCASMRVYEQYQRAKDEKKKKMD